MIYQQTLKIAIRIMTKKFKMLSVLCFILHLNGNAQTRVYQKTYGNNGNDRGFAVANTIDGGYVFIGYSSSYGGGDFDVVLNKLDSDATLEWSKSYGGSGNDYAFKIVQCIDGGFAIVGMTQSFGSGGYDALLLKTDDNGTMQFMKTYGGVSDDRFLNIRQTADSGFILAGSTTNFGFGNWDMLYVKTDANGDTLWTKVIGSAAYDQGTDAIETNNSEFVFLGRTLSWGAGSSDVFLAKATASGDTLWSKTYGGTGWEEALRIKQTFDNGFVFTGATNGFTNGGYQTYLNKVDSDGNLMWSKAYGGDYTETSYDVVQLPDSGYAMVGTTESYGSNHLRIAATSGHANPFNAGGGNEVMGNDNTNVFLVRVDVNGDTLWSYAYGGNLQDEGFSLLNTADKGFLLATYSLSFTTDTNDFYLIKTDSNGFSGCNETQSNPQVYNPATIVSATTAQINSGLIVTTVNPVALAPITVIQNTLCYLVLTGLTDIKNGDEGLTVFPNPCKNKIEIAKPQAFNQANNTQLTIYDVMGKQVKNLTISIAETSSVNVSDLVSGIYFLRSENYSNGKVYSTKIIVE